MPKPVKKLKIGDTVIMHRPKTLAKRRVDPGWLGLMDPFDGRKGTITKITATNICEIKNIKPWLFHSDWLELTYDDTVEGIFNDLKSEVTKKSVTKKS